jgi:hypothetical protein
MHIVPPGAPKIAVFSRNVKKVLGIGQLECVDMLAEHALDTHHNGFATLLLGLRDLQTEEPTHGWVGTVYQSACSFIRLTFGGGHKALISVRDHQERECFKGFLNLKLCVPLLITHLICA